MLDKTHFFCELAKKSTCIILFLIICYIVKSFIICAMGTIFHIKQVVPHLVQHYIIFLFYIKTLNLIWKCVQCMPNMKFCEYQLIIIILSLGVTSILHVTWELRNSFFAALHRSKLLDFSQILKWKIRNKTNPSFIKFCILMYFVQKKVQI